MEEYRTKELGLDEPEPTALDLLEAHLMEDGSLLDVDISSGTLTLIDEQVRVLEEQIGDSGEIPGANVTFRALEEQDRKAWLD